MTVRLAAAIALLVLAIVLLVVTGLGFVVAGGTCGEGGSSTSGCFPAWLYVLPVLAVVSAAGAVWLGSRRLGHGRT